MHSSVLTKGFAGLLPLIVGPNHSLKARQNEPTPSDDLDALFPRDNIRQILDAEGLNDLPTVNSTLSRWDDGLVPRSCADILQYTEERLVGGECSVDTLEVYNLTYSDCSDPWVLCRCSDAPDIMEDSLADFGRLPVATRENVRSLILSPEHSFGEGSQVLGAALSQTGDMIVYGNESSMSVFIHETAHILDFLMQRRSPLSYSQLSTWRNIVEDDSCVADNYSTTSYSEAYAQTAVLVSYELNVGSLDDIVNYTCMSNAIDAVTEQLGDFLTYNEDATCNPIEDRFPPIDVWCVDDGEAGPCGENGPDNDDGDDDDGDDDQQDNNDNGDNGDDGNSNNNNGDNGNGDNNNGDNNNGDNDNGDNDNNDNDTNDNDNNDNDNNSNGDSGASRSVSATGLFAIVVTAALHVSGLV